MPSQRGDWLGGLSGRAGGGEAPRNQFVTFGTQRCYSFLFGCSGCWSFAQLGGFFFWADSFFSNRRIVRRWLSSVSGFSSLR
jgi:hypothetical protein